LVRTLHIVDNIARRFPRTARTSAPNPKASAATTRFSPPGRLIDDMKPVTGPLHTRRAMLARCGTGFGLLGLAGALGDAGDMSPADTLDPFEVKRPHFEPKARRIVHLFMNGGPSQVDTFDPKPLLARYHEKTLPGSLRTERKTGYAMKSPFSFAKCGES